MPVKATGKDYKDFANSLAETDFIPTEILVVNGAEWSTEQEEDFDRNQIPDDAKVTIVEGTIFCSKTDESRDLLKEYRSWSKAQSTARIIVECDKTIKEAVEKAIKEAGGKVL
ncbi:hypothetical protein [Ectothiorhodospira shaposhnikovii]|uniref:hypothetical protein n=1 Tax=Ectothiorhodospira shaposhnikovii TaxID=1054 RepID=UPI001EE8EB2F|nr:hypothetical protein [Ectothiorhodospira shaposhnikovii]MCG5512813.1 hypothetical protein [Ectothiorhodospira shaposhnikovii]